MSLLLMILLSVLTNDMHPFLSLYIAETGWPTGANDTASMTYQGAVAGIPELNTFLSDYVCQANQNITTGDKFSNYFFFEGEWCQSSLFLLVWRLLTIALSLHSFR